MIMKNLGKAAFTVGALAVVAAGCFSDPTSDLRGGPDRLTLSNTVVVQRVGETDQIDIQVKDQQGNSLPFGAPTFTSLDPTIATMAPLPDPTLVTVPGNTLFKSVLTALSSGTTRIVVTADGVSDTVTVFVLPVTSGSATVGASLFGPASELTITAPPNTSFNTTGATSTVSFGLAAGTITSLTAGTITVVSPINYTGPVTVRNMVTVTQDVDSIVIPSVTIAAATNPGTMVVSAGPLGPGTLLTLTPPTGGTFSATASTVTFGATAGIILTRTATQIEVISPSAYTGPVTVSNITVNGVLMHPLPSATNATVAAAAFPGTFSNGGGAMVDTVVINSGASATFAATSAVTINGAAAWIISNSGTVIRAIARRGGTGSIAVTNVIVGGVTIPSLISAATLTVSTTVSGEPNEPANDAPAGTPIVITGATAAAPNVRFGTIDDGGGAGDLDDFFTFTITGTRTVVLNLQFFGTGAGGGTNPDVDLLACNAACSAFLPGGTAGATAGNPEVITLTGLAAGTYNVWVNGWDTGTATFAYRLQVHCTTAGGC